MLRTPHPPYQVGQIADVVRRMRHALNDAQQGKISPETARELIHAAHDEAARRLRENLAHFEGLLP